MKRTIFIIVAVLAAAGLVFLGIWFRSRGGQPPATGQGPEPGGSLPVVTGGANDLSPNASSSLTVATLSKNDVVDYAVNSAGELVFIKSDGQVIRSSSTDVIVNSIKVNGLIAARFSRNGQKVLVKSGDTESPRWSVYDVPRNAWRQLDLQARDAIWAPGDLRIAYAGRRLSGTALSVWDLSSDRSRPTVLSQLSAEDLEVQWMDANSLIVGERSSARVEGTLWVVPVRGGAWSVFAESIRGTMYLPNGTGKGLLFKSAGAVGGSLMLVGDNGEELERFSFLTLPSKCAFYKVAGTSTLPASEKLACAMPRDTRLMSGAELPDAYEKRSLMPIDNIFSIDLASGAFTSIIESSQFAFDATALKVYGSDIYFINRLDQKLYRLPLK